MSGSGTTVGKRAGAKPPRGRYFSNSPMAFLGEGGPTLVIERTRRGLSASVLDFMAKTLGISRSSMLEIVRIKPSTAERRIREKQLLTPEESDRIVRVARVTQRAIEVFEDEDDAKAWLKRPITSLGGVAPLSLLDTAEGYQLVTDTLGRIEYGVYG
jgi:putative toxin-antitoxin system antitoxin component (TIGR02293 family)